MDKAQIKRHVVEFSRNLLETEGWRWCHDRDNLWTPEEQVTREENELLCRPISVEEVKEAINQIWADIAPGPDGFSMSFYQGCWGIIEQDFMKLVRGFQAGTLNVAKINQAAICLVPKKSNPKTVREYRPISLINCGYKIIAKVLSNRLMPVVARLVSENQTAFLEKRYILDSVVTAPELVHRCHQSKEKGVAIKLNFEKAYDQVHLGYLEEVLQQVSVQFGYSGSCLYGLKLV